MVATPESAAARAANEAEAPQARAPANNPMYFSFVGGIDDSSATRIATAMNHALNSGADEVHLAFSSLGGYVAHGIYLYNHLRSMPFRTIAYNTGSVASIAVAIFVGADERYCSKHSMFMIHPTAFPNLQGMTWDRLRSTTDAALADDERTESILRERARLPDELLKARRTCDVHIAPGDALAHGLVDGIAEFQIPQGVQVLQI